jgi:hypothetical protein
LRLARDFPVCVLLLVSKHALPKRLLEHAYACRRRKTRTECNEKIILYKLMDFVITDYVSIEEAYDKMIEYEKKKCNT